jgi:hypothetical protein
MFDPFTQWRRLAAAGTSIRSTGAGALNMFGGAGEVIAARGAIMGDAMRSPWTVDYGELGRMLPEKLDAFSRVGSAAAAVWWDSQTAWIQHMQHVGVMAMRGRAPTAAEAADLGDRSAKLMMTSLEAAAKLGAATLAPVSRQVNANVRRLKTANQPRARRSRQVSH